MRAIFAFTAGPCLLLATLFAAPAAAIVITDNFSDNNDTANPEWTHLDQEIGSSGQTWDASTGAYRLTAQSNGFEIGSSGMVGFAGSYIGSTSFTDVTATADFVSPTPAGYQFGVMVRANGVNSFGGLNGYTYGYRGGVPRMEIVRFNGFTIGSIASTDLTAPLDFANKQYRMVLTAIGTQITGNIYEIGGGLISTTTVSNSEITDGYSGIFGLSGSTATGITPTTPLGTSLDFTIDNFRTETAAVPLTGDYNGDGKVDAADFVVWRDTNINGPQGYTDWRANFGNPPGSGAGLGSSAVPEPSACVLMLLSSLAIRSIRRTRK